MTAAWRPLHRSLTPAVLELHAEQRTRGWTPSPVHLALTQDVEPQPFRTACSEHGAIGEWITGDVAQVTCKPCIEQARA